MIFMLALAAAIAQSPPPVATATLPPPTIGQSCADYFRSVRDIQAKTPDDRPLPEGHLITCTRGRVTAYGPRPAEPAGPMPNLYSQPTRCGPVADEITRRINAATQGRPPGAFYAVVRTVDGCGVPAPIDYHPDYLLPGPWDAKPADERLRKR